MNPVKLITIFLIAIVILFGLFVWIQSPAPQTRSEIVAPTDDWIEQRLAFHGIECAICNEQGECWFLRDGKKCKL